MHLRVGHAVSAAGDVFHAAEIWAFHLKRFRWLCTVARMKAMFAAIILAGWIYPARASLQGLERVNVAGNSYVRLSEWADDYGFHVKWLRKGESLEVANSSVMVDLEIDSRKALVGGVTVWLSLPVVDRNGSALISLSDLQSTFQPILVPQKASGHVKTICLDAGHGGKDTGKIDKQNYEKKYTLLLEQELSALLKHAGFKVVATRELGHVCGIGGASADC